METTPALSGLACTDCGTTHDPGAATHRCPDCGGVLDATYDLDAVDADPDAIAEDGVASQFRYGALLPVPRGAAVTLEEGGTPLVACESLAADLGVESVYVKDEGRNQTGTAVDRGMALAATAAREHGAEDVALPSTGDAGHSAAAYAARAGHTARVFLPSRAGFVTKAMVNVHAGDMRVTEGRFPDAVAAYEAARESDGEDWYPVAAFDTPYRHEGAKTLFFEVAERLGWEAPDAVVVPVGTGEHLVGMQKGARELAALGVVDRQPRFYAAQSEGCAPVVRAFQEGAASADAWQSPDTICGRLEVPDPAGGDMALAALRESDGGAVATSDDDILESAAAVAGKEGVEMDPSGAAAASGAWALARRDAFDPDDTVVVVNTGAGAKAADVVRSYLMGQGV